jgi:hypothetical protein
MLNIELSHNNDDYNDDDDEDGDYITKLTLWISRK